MDAASRFAALACKGLPFYEYAGEFCKTVWDDVALNHLFWPTQARRRPRLFLTRRRSRLIQCLFLSSVRYCPNIVDLPPIHKEFSPEHIYDRQSLLDIGNAYKHELSPVAAEKLQGLCLLLKPDLETAASPTDATRTRRCRKRCERGRKRR